MFEVRYYKERKLEISFLHPGSESMGGHVVHR